MKVRIFLLLVCTYLSGCVSDKAIYADYGNLACQRVCPEVSIIPWPSVVNFDFDKSSLTESEKNKITQAVEVLKENTSFNVAVIGATDQMGTDEYNNALSLRRANIVGEYLESQGINSSRITLIGTGEKELFIKTNNESKNRANRRTQLILLDANHDPVTLFYHKMMPLLEPNIINTENSL